MIVGYGREISPDLVLVGGGVEAVGASEVRQDLAGGAV